MVLIVNGYSVFTNNAEKAAALMANILAAHADHVSRGSPISEGGERTPHNDT